MLFTNCETSQNDAKKMADKANDAKTETRASEMDADALVKAVNINYYKIAAAEYAATQATQPQVREFANMMRTQHMAMNDKTKSLAASKSFTAPAAMSNDYMNDIENMRKWEKGKEFDTKFINEMVDAHQEALDMLEKCQRESNDADVKAWATESASGVRNHLDMARRLDDQLSNMYK